MSLKTRQLTEYFTAFNTTVALQFMLNREMFGLVFKGIAHPNTGLDWNDMRVIKLWQIFKFGVKHPFRWTCHLLIVWYDIRVTFSGFYCCKSPDEKLKNTDEMNLNYWFSVRQVVINIITFCLLVSCCSYVSKMKSAKIMQSLSAQNKTCAWTFLELSNNKKNKNKNKKHHSSSSLALIIRVFERTADDKTRHDKNICLTHLIRNLKVAADVPLYFFYHSRCFCIIKIMKITRRWKLPVDSMPSVDCFL